MNSLLKYLLLPALICSLLISSKVCAQDSIAVSKKMLIIIHTDRLSNEKRDTVEWQSLAGHDTLRQDNTMFYCDSAVLNKKINVLEAFGNVHINDADSIHTYANYVRYLGNEKKAFLKGNVKLTDGKGTLTTPELNYDLNTKIGSYTKGGKLVSEKTVLTSKEGYYYGETRDVFFKKKVLLVNPEHTVKTDTLLFNTYTQIATFVVPTEILGKNSHITTTDGYYDFKKKQSYFGKRSKLIDGSATLIADEIANDDSTGFGEARGNVIFIDTTQNITLIANNLKSNKNNSSFLATEQPVVIIKQDSDSIFIAADTLYSGKVTDLEKTRTIPAVRDSVGPAPDSSHNRFIEAYYHVRIFSDSLQAICDSMFYSAADSTFRLLQSPIIWAKESQITGDTIYLFIANKKPERIYVIDNALLINKVGNNNYFNQLKGRIINGYFKEGNMDYVRARGSQAENIYYALDSKNLYIGVNKSAADLIDINFQNQNPDRVKFTKGATGTMYPMKQVNHEEIKLGGFRWLSDKRPKSKFELFEKPK